MRQAFEIQNSDWEEECRCSIFRPFGRRRRPELRNGREEVPRFDEFKITNPAAIASADIASQPCKCCIATKAFRATRRRRLRSATLTKKSIFAERIRLRQRIHSCQSLAATWSTRNFTQTWAAREPCGPAYIVMNVSRNAENCRDNAAIGQGCPAAERGREDI